MGEARKDALRVDFDRSVKLEFHGSTIRSDGGLLAYRELDEPLGLTAEIEELGLVPHLGSNMPSAKRRQNKWCRRCRSPFCRHRILSRPIDGCQDPTELQQQTPKAIQKKGRYPVVYLLSKLRASRSLGRIP